ncbi:dockerin type I domain-containing protein [Clostridium cellulovorans]|uniref:Dockerin type 1 n=2 Tax=Clostridium cellulovorans TaxID=1493 RepID=D9SS67_CLOC7|nr:dockerin type I domain-containing protein [Clostridium cellulovorans]AAF06110.2 mannanase A [Clostridium cellulovorans 743B]ADL52514.1 Dockerin type 1 [Clostridium cellulovorans 743B]
MKRRILSILTAALVTATIIPFSASAATTLGDVNVDGKVNSIDMAIVKQYILGTKTFSDAELKAADVDANGKVNAIDLALYKQYILGSITKFPGDKGVVDNRTTTGPGITWMDGYKLFPVGVNYGWNNWCYEFSDSNWDTNFAKMKSDMDAMNLKGVKSLRWWVFPDLAFGPTWSGTGKGSLCTGLPNNWVNHMKAVCDYALTKNIKIYWTLTSFDAARQDGTDHHSDIFTNEAVRQSFFDNAVKPIVTALGNHEAVMGWDCINEPEWIIKKEDNGEPKASGYDIYALSDIRNYVQSTTALIHQYAKQPVSVGSASMKWSGAQFSLWTGLGLDFYDFHWYDWATPWFNPMTTPASSLKLDKPVIIGEMMSDTLSSSLKVDHKVVMDAIMANGYSGYMTWAWNDGSCGNFIGSNFTNFGAQHTDIVR